MIGLERGRRGGKAGSKAATLALVMVTLAACASTEHLGGSPPDQVAATPPPPPATPPQPPPVDLSGKWRLSVTGSGGCQMSLGDTAGAAEGSIAPAGGCPGAFFTSRKWSFEHDKLTIRDHKGSALVELSFADGRFQGAGANGAAVTLAR